VLDLPLPEVAAAHAQVNFDDMRCFGNAASRSVPEAAWRKLEAPLTGGESTVGACLDLRRPCRPLAAALAVTEGHNHGHRRDGPASQQTADNHHQLSVSNPQRRFAGAAVYLPPQRADVQCGLPVCAGSWLTSGSKSRLGLSSAPAVLGSCVADEAVTVDVEVANPLQVSRL